MHKSTTPLIFLAALFSCISICSCIRTPSNTATYFPSDCRSRCTQQEDLQQPLPATADLDNGSRPTQWSIVLLNAIRENVKYLSPPGVARILATFSTCMYDTVALLQDWKPRYCRADLIEDQLLAMTLAASTANRRPADIGVAVSGAAYTVLKNFFGNTASEESIDKFLLATRDNMTTNNFAPFALGVQACRATLSRRSSDGSNEDGRAPTSKAQLPYADNTDYYAINDVLDLSHNFNCSVDMRSINHWQPLCVPSTDGGKCRPQSFVAAWAAFMKPWFMDSPASFLPLEGPPVYGSVGSNDKWIREADEVLGYSSHLDDTMKVITEHWMDGPIGTTPPGHWFYIATQEAQHAALNTTETVKLLFAVSGALVDAAVTSWNIKRFFSSSRPLTMIRCMNQGEQVLSWMGPYKGVGSIDGEAWIPYQMENFVSPGFPGYVSGHSTFSAAASTVLKSFFGNDTFMGPSCALVPEGASLIEPRKTQGVEGFIPGVTDVPNSGPASVGYSPATDTVLCWDSYSEAADQAGISRLYGGIHIAADNVDGLSIGRQVGEHAYEKAKLLWE